MKFGLVLGRLVVLKISAKEDIMVLRVQPYLLQGASARVSQQQPLTAELTGWSKKTQLEIEEDIMVHSV